MMTLVESLKRSLMQEGTEKEKEINDNDTKIESKTELQEYAYAILKKAHGEKFDKSKADDMVDSLIEKYGDDFKTMAGIVQNSVD